MRTIGLKTETPTGRERTTTIRLYCVEIKKKSNEERTDDEVSRRCRIRRNTRRTDEWTTVRTRRAHGGAFTGDMKTRSSVGRAARRVGGDG